MNVTWSNFREYRDEGQYLYATVDYTVTGIFGIVVKRKTNCIYKAGPYWQSLETGYYMVNNDQIECMHSAYLARAHSITFRENARLASMVHVVPTADTREHNETGPCWCNPEIKDGVVIHNSADGREAEEEAAEAAASK